MSSIEKQIALQIELEKDVDLADRAEICMDCIRELLGYSGYTVEEVKGLIEFYLDELESIAEEMHFGKAVNAVRIFRKNLPRTMSYLNHMFTRTEEYATERGISGVLLKHVYRLRRFVKGSEAYFAELKKVLLQNRCDASVYREAQKLMDFVVDTNRRASSMVENLNGRIRPYMNIKRSVSDHFTELLKLYYNTKIALRSRVKERIGTSPIGRIIGENLDFFELLDMEEIADLASVLKGKTNSEVA